LYRYLGKFLYKCLYAARISNQSNSDHLNDGLKLKNTYITTALKCVPPKDKPLKNELNNCFNYLNQEIYLLKNLKVIIALGKIAFDTYVKFCKKNYKINLKFKFGHIEKNPALVMIIFSETSFQYSSVLSSIVAKIMEQRSKKIIELLKEGQKNNEIRNDIDPEQLAIIIMGGIRKTILNWKLEGFKSDLNLEGGKLWITIEKLIKKWK